MCVCQVCHHTHLRVGEDSLLNTIKGNDNHTELVTRTDSDPKKKERGVKMLKMLRKAQISSLFLWYEFEGGIKEM